MARAFIDTREEVPALRRAAVLLERVRQDGGAADSELELLQVGIGTLQQAASAGRFVHPAAIDRMEALLERVTAPSASSSQASVQDLVRWNALVETREVLARLART